MMPYNLKLLDITGLYQVRVFLILEFHFNANFGITTDNLGFRVLIL
jgi:hypothetical protein